MSALMFGQLRAHLSRVRHGAYLVSGSHDACHGRLRGLGRRECWVPATGGQGCLVVPTRGLLGVRGGGGGACDSQEVPGDRLAPGGGGRSRRPRAARGRGERGVRRPVRPTDSATLAFLLFFKQPSSCLPQGLRICHSIRSAFPPDLLAPSHPSGPDEPVKPPWRAPPATCM
ncbi:ferredoxin-2, mitochondrial isoform X7 [Delphinus delphis]|uniref:ferredoxin-2, mitochondrial isoform X7 n=1 Tax=Delphinus delphis TaxID=9728 RepID=UPI0028C4BA8E|nr:ferredoxin-2, mitochondrial isoform X6 [Delphinus delphis]